MRKGQAKFIFLGIVVFVMICFLASPMPAGETGQSFDNQIEESLDNFNSTRVNTLSSGESWFSGWGYRFEAITICGSAYSVYIE